MHNAAKRLDEYRPLNGLQLLSSDQSGLIEGLASELAGVTSTLATVELFGRYRNQGEEWLRFQVACSYFYLFLIEVSLDAVDCTLSEKNQAVFREKVAARLYIRQYEDKEKSSGMLEYFLAYYSSNLDLWYDIAATAPDSDQLIAMFCEWVSKSCQVDIDAVRLGNNLKSMWDKKIVPVMTSLITPQGS
jgi:hypothetical protein